MLLSPGKGRKEMDHATVRKRQDAMKRNKEAGRAPREITAIVGDKVRLKKTDGTFSDPIRLRKLIAVGNFNRWSEVADE